MLLRVMKTRHASPARVVVNVGQMRRDVREIGHKRATHPAFGNMDPILVPRANLVIKAHASPNASPILAGAWAIFPRFAT